MKEFKIRASACGDIMKNDRSGKGMGATVKTYLEKWVKEQIYSRRQEFSNKYTQKGNEVEDNSLDFISDQLGLGILIKNDEYFENDFCTGTPDAITPDFIIDVKNSWDCFTFPLFETECPNDNYFYQAQVYMYLTGATDYKLIYVLSDTPEHLIQKEAFFYARNNGHEEVDIEMWEQFKAKMTYSDIPDSLKIKVFNIKRDDAVIEQIQQRVLLCRDYIKNELLTKINL